MKYERTHRSTNDYPRLQAHEKELFKRDVSLMNEAYTRRGERSIQVWPKKLRVNDVEGAQGIWEMTWDWPNGRATFDYIDLGSGDVAIRWRRIGGHEIFGDP